jgi:NADH dehydrogenase/NADH:ubiquinone oxidoreductase subunit G
MSITIKVNGRDIKAKKGEPILDVLNRHGLNVPTLC